MKKNKWVWYAIPIVIGAYIIYRKFKQAKGVDAPDTLTKTEDTKVTTTKGGGSASATVKYFPLRRGSRGAKVTELQKAILSYDSSLLPKFGADGDFGSETESAVQTILGKKSVSSQQEIGDIIEKAAQRKRASSESLQRNIALQKLAEENSARKALASELIKLARGTNNDFYALVDTWVVEYKVTSDGREIESARRLLKPNDRVKVDARTRYVIGTTGLIVAYVGKDVMKSFSPWGFEVR